MLKSRVSNCIIIKQYLSSLLSRIPSICNLFSSSDNSPLLISHENASVSSAQEIKKQSEIRVEISNPSYQTSMQKLLEEKGLFTPLAQIVLAYTKNAYFEYEDPGVCATMIHDILPRKSKEDLMSLCQNYTVMRLQVVRSGINDEIYYADLKIELDYMKMRFSKMSDKDDVTTMQDLTLQYYNQYNDARKKKEDEDHANMRRFRCERQRMMHDGYASKPYGSLSRY